MAVDTGRLGTGEAGKFNGGADLFELSVPFVVVVELPPTGSNDSGVKVGGFGKSNENAGSVKGAGAEDCPVETAAEEVVLAELGKLKAAPNELGGFAPALGTADAADNASNKARAFEDPLEDG